VDSKELSLGEITGENLSSEHLDISQYSDAYTKELEQLIDSKSKVKTIVVMPGRAKEETKDFVAALKASLQKTKTKG
jgi:DNA end-binding protein Ku